MQAKHQGKYILGLAAVTAAGLSALTGCGDSGYSSSSASLSTTPMASSAQSLDTAQVLAQAQQSSEQSLPYQLDDGALMLTDSSDSSEPISVSANP